MRLEHRALGLAALLVVCASARADESNFRPYLVGGRAAGMGGAFTALADDGSGPYYNPGGLAFVDRSMLSLSASVYGIVRGTVRDGLGAGHDFSHSDLNAFPVSTSAIRKFGTLDSSGVARNAVAFSVFVPDAMVQDDHDKLGRSDNWVLYTTQQQTIWAGATCARRFGRLGVGASGFVLVGMSTEFLDMRQGSPSSFRTSTFREDITVVGAVGAFGVRYDLGKSVKLGASFYSPEMGISGSRRVLARDEQNSGSTVISLEGLHATPSLPWRASAGIAWTSGEVTLAADAMVLGAREARDDDDPSNGRAARLVRREMVFNGSAGLEYVIAGRFPVRAGVFTDFASSPSLPSANWRNSSHVDRYGGTVSIGQSTTHTSTDLGINASYGTGQDIGADRLGVNWKVARATQTLFYLFLGTSYRF